MRLPSRSAPGALPLFAVVVVLLSAAHAPVAAQGLTAVPAAFADVGTGSRGAAMGNTGTAGSTGVESASWNPASAASMDRLEVAFNYLDQFGMVSYSQAQLGFRMGRSWGFVLSALDTGDDALRETTLSVTAARRTGPFSLGVRGSALLARFGRNDLSEVDYSVFDADEVAAGMARQVQGDATGFALDVGLRIGGGRTAGGVVVRNLVAPVTWNSSAGGIGRSYSESIPLEVVVGAQFPLGPRTLISMDYRPAYDAELDNVVRAGAEFLLADVLAFRIGTERTLNGRNDERYTVGFGVLPALTRSLGIGANYAYASGILGGSQQFSLQLRFP